MAEIKQYEQKLISNDLWASSRSISTLISDPSKLDMEYASLYREKTVNGPLDYAENQDLFVIDYSGKNPKII